MNVIDRGEFCATIFPMSRWLYLSSRLVSHQLCAIAYSQYGQVAKFTHVYIGRAGIANRTRASGKNYSADVRTYFRDLVEGVDFAIDVQFTNSSCNELGVLRSEIQD